jgi:5-methyltetrahydropteroyltriglutamate--homocysteine methyltransferase
MFTTASTGTLGFPRMGPNRELKFALESFWKGDSSAMDLLQVAHKIEESAWKLQVDAGIERITAGDHFLYDGVLTWTDRLGICPRRFQSEKPGLDRMFAMARGVDGSEAFGTLP